MNKHSSHSLISTHDLKILLLGVLFCALMVIFNDPRYLYKKIIYVDNYQETSLQSLEETSLLLFPYASLKNSLLLSCSDCVDVHFHIVYSNGFQLRAYPVERIPVVTLQYKQRMLFLDAHGIVFSSKKSFGGLRVVRLDDKIPLQIGKPLMPPFANIILGFNSILASRDDFKGDLYKMALTLNGEWKIITPGGMVIRAGGLDGISNRLDVLPTLIEAINRKKLSVAYIDLRSENTAFIKLQDGRKGTFFHE